MPTKSFALVLASSALLAFASPASAQGQPTYAFDIPATTLDDALKSVSRQTGREIIYPADAVAGLRSRRLVARLPADEAVRVLLEGTELQAEFRSEAVVIRRTGRGTQAAASNPDIVVTGTRIRGAATALTATYSREQARAEGLNELGEIIRSLPQNYSGGQNPGVGGGGQPGSEDVNSSSALNLRGLGPDATLTLVNGHRMAYDAAAQGVDIAAIPLIAIERLEVLTDGSSALYGSDAVGGVANVILRSPFDGGEARARLSVPTAGGGVQHQLSLLAGSLWNGGGVIAALDYLDAEAIDAGDRRFTRTVDPEATVLPGQTQYSGVLAGRHRLSDRLSFALDSHFSSRSSFTSTPFFSPGDVDVDGVVVDRKVEGYSIAPSLTWDPAPDWQVKLGGVHGVSTSVANSLNRSGGQDFIRAFASYRNAIDSVELGAEGAVADLPGGTIRLALGGGWRGVELDAYGRSVISGVPRVGLDLVQRYDVGFAYAEAALPVIGPGNARPGVQALTLNGAVRYEHYSGLSGVAVPKLSARYDPVRALSLRASWSESFKAPTLLQRGQLPRGFILPAAIFRPRPARGSTVILVNAGNDDLQPERAETWTLGAVFTPFAGQDVRLEAMYSNLRYRDRVTAPIISLVTVFGDPVYAPFLSVPTVAEVNALNASIPLGLLNQTGAPFDPASVGAIIDNRIQNIASFRVETVDVALHAATRSARLGELSFDGSVSYIESDQQISAGQPTIARAGTIFDPPTWRGRGALGWRRGELAATGVFTHIGGTLDNRFTPESRVGSFNTLDLTVSWSPGSTEGPLAGTTLTMSALNIFEEEPDTFTVTDPATAPFDSTNYPSTGRVLSLSLAKRW